MPHTVKELLHMSAAQLDALFGASPAGPIPDGVADGTALIAPGSDVAEAVAKLAALLWQGKIFDAKHGTLVNRIAGHDIVEAQVYLSPSLFDDRSCIVLDYSKSTKIAEHIRDEIRLIDPDFYLGKVYWDNRPLIHFCLQFR